MEDSSGTANSTSSCSRESCFNETNEHGISVKSEMSNDINSPETLSPDCLRRQRQFHPPRQRRRGGVHFRSRHVLTFASDSISSCYRRFVIAIVLLLVSTPLPWTSSNLFADAQRFYYGQCPRTVPTASNFDLKRVSTSKSSSHFSRSIKISNDHRL